MYRFIVSVHNGFDIDDYYINAETAEEACDIASYNGAIWMCECVGEVE